MDRKKDIGKLLTLLCPLIYFASYLTRKDYSIVMEAIIQAESLSKESAGLIETLSVISYGIGQIVSGFLGDRIRPDKMVTKGMIITVLINLAMPFSDASLRGILWFINGFAHSLLWPPILRILTSTMERKDYENVAVNMNIAGIFATVLVYLSSSLLWIRVFRNWKLTFLVDAVIAALITAFWIIYSPRIEEAMETSEVPSEMKKESTTPSLHFKSFLIFSGFLFIALAIILQGMLRDGIGDWLPSFMANTFHMESDSAIFGSVILPVIGIISLKITGIINRRFVNDEVKASAILFICSFALSSLLYGIYEHDRNITLIIASLIVATMHAINLFLVGIIPSRFIRYGLVSTMSGIINSLTYVGSASAIYGFGYLSQHFGWNACLFTWIIISLLGALSCFLAIKPWNRFRKQRSSRDIL